MPALNLSATVLASRDTLRLRGALNLGISISDSNGSPVGGLDETQVQVALADGSRVQTPGFLFSAQVQATDADGNPIFDENGQPVMIPAPGAARPLGLPGFYLIILMPPPEGWLTSPITVEVAIRMGADSGQAFASFVEESEQFRGIVEADLRDSSTAIFAIASAYEDTGRRTQQLKGYPDLARGNQVSDVSDLVRRIGIHLGIPGF